MQLELFPAYTKRNHPRTNGAANKLDSYDKRFHDWYRFVLSFPPHLVREYLERFNLLSGQILLDPFCGTGTTLVEAKIHGIDSIGIEANPMAHFASSMKVNWEVDSKHLLNHAAQIADIVDDILKTEGCENLRKLPPESDALLLTESISPLPLHKSLVLLEEIRRHENTPYYGHELLAFAKSLVFSVSNLHFGPEVGVHRIKKDDADVVESWLKEIRSMSDDLYNQPASSASAVVYCSDSRVLPTTIKHQSIDAVFTSPPYPNEKDYTRTTRLESVLLGFIRNKEGLRLLKKGLLRSNTRNVYKGDDDDSWVSEHIQIQHIADTIEKRRIELGKTSGFEKLYGKVTKLYFGGMARHLAQLRPFLKPGAHLGYVVGDQASYLQVLIPTGKILSDIAQSLGYEAVSMDLFRTRFATATRKQLREEVVVLRWPG